MILDLKTASSGIIALAAFREFREELIARQKNFQVLFQDLRDINKTIQSF